MKAIEQQQRTMWRPTPRVGSLLGPFFFDGGETDLEILTVDHKL